MNVLINRTDAIGDLILTLPMIVLLKKEMPEANITLVVAERTMPVVVNNPFIDNIWVIPQGLSFFQELIFLVKKFRQHSFESYFFIGGKQWISALAFFFRVKIRGGILSRPLSYLFLNKGLRQQRSLVEMHESDYNMRLLEVLGIKYDYQKKEDYRPRIFLTDQERTQALQNFQLSLTSQGIDHSFVKSMIFIHPGMSGHTLNWPILDYAKMIELIEKRHPGKFLFVISHTPSDRLYVDLLKESIVVKEDNRPLIYYFNGAIHGLRNYMSILERAQLFIGPSTGTTHLAHALDVDLIGIYSPIKVQSVWRWGPYSYHTKKSRVVIPDVICSEQFKCALEKCPYYECMGKLEIEEVLEEVDGILLTKSSDYAVDLKR